MKQRYQQNNNRLCSQIIVDFLVSKKIGHVFDLAGGMITYLEDAISRTPGIECVPVHHEQAAGFAAEGYARVGQNFGVALATSGPGATNLLTAVGSCYFDSVPVLFITGQVHTENIKKNSEVRQEGFQETDVVSMVTTITKYSVLVTKPEEVLYELEKAFFFMKTGRPGPVLVDIPINIQRTEVDFSQIKKFFGSKEHKKLSRDTQKLTVVPSSKIKTLEKILSSSVAPLIVVGNGVRIAKVSKELHVFSKRNSIPVVSSLLGLDSFGDDALFVGYIGSNGNRDANIAFANADVILVLGSRLDVRQIGNPKFFNKKAKIVHVDIDESTINYMLPAELAFHCDLNVFFEAVKHIKITKKDDWFSFLRCVHDNFKREYLFPETTVDPNSFFKRLSSFAEDGTIVAVDVGQNQMWCAQSWKLKKNQRLLFSGGMGAMGFSLPVAIGAWHANKKAPIFVTTGDGGLQINIQEMETVSRNRIPLKLFVLNNKSLGMVREFQDLYFNKNYQSTVKGYGCPDLLKIANAYNFEYFNLKKSSDVEENLERIISLKTPTLVEVNIDMYAKLEPKIVYGHALDDQAPYLDERQRAFLEKLKQDLYA